MAGGTSTPQLVAAVGEAGGLGFLAAGYIGVARLADDVAATRALTRTPFGVNVFVPPDAATPAPDEAALAAYRARLAATEGQRYGVEPGPALADDDAWAEKLELLLTARPAVVSFTFGCPGQPVLAALAAAGVETWVTVTSPDEARRALAAGAGGLVLQGSEAGGHRGCWVDDGGEGSPLLELVRQVAAESGGGVPLVAAGGIMDGAGLAAALAAGAWAGQLGSAFLLAPEAGTSAVQRAAVAAGDRPTALTRAFSGRTARGIANRFMAEHGDVAPAGYPQVHHMTAPLRAAARELGDAEGVNLWAGRQYRLAVARPAGETVRAIAAGRPTE